MANIISKRLPWTLESRYHFPDWPVTSRGRANLMASLAGYGKPIELHSGDALVVHRCEDSRVVILEYDNCSQ